LGPVSISLANFGRIFIGGAVGELGWFPQACRSTWYFGAFSSRLSAHALLSLYMAEIIPQEVLCSLVVLK